MRIIKPSWIRHLDDKNAPQTIFSLHVHPDGSRLVTGSLQNKVKIWSTGPILDENKEKLGDDLSPRLLSDLEGHDGALSLPGQVAVADLALEPHRRRSLRTLVVERQPLG